jgi:hypothetical protein
MDQLDELFHPAGFWEARVSFFVSYTIHVTYIPYPRKALAWSSESLLHIYVHYMYIFLTLRNDRPNWRLHVLGVAPQLLWPVDCANLPVDTSGKSYVNHLTCCLHLFAGVLSVPDAGNHAVSWASGHRVLGHWMQTESAFMAWRPKVGCGGF